MANPADQLRSIKTFDDLILYLQDELDWPLAEYDFEDLTFEYAPQELGLKEEEAAKVKAIHQLRPLQAGQPWGIFFVEFDNKRIPVVVMRRILSHLVLKKRASANQAQRAAWLQGDLLFISAFGDEASDQREIAFAHFHQRAGDLPTLRVLGWDGADTGLKLDFVAATLQQRLHWPADPDDRDAWREQWSGVFRHRIGHVIRTSDMLAERLAGLARAIRGAASTLMAYETEHGPLRRLHKAFQSALIHDLTEEDFADTYAQTVTYGLLTAAIQRTDLSGGALDTTLYSDMLADVVPITNPFLREMLQTFLQAGGRQGGIDFDELGIQDVVELLRGEETDLPAILRDFGNKTRGEDPVIHFYEHFLAAYDKALKVKRGIFYTPQPVVTYIVRSVHALLQSEFGLDDGLASTATWCEMAKRFPDLTIPAGTDPASHFVVILDPATGTGTFLVEAIEVVHKTLTAKWRSQGLSEAQRREAWNAYVPQHLLPRLYGYELMMAPYAIAHMKIGLKLHETGYNFRDVERVRVYLTNALEPASDVGGQMAFVGWAPELAHEAEAVNAVKRQQRFTAVIGNPPYSANSANVGKWITELVQRAYYPEDDIKENNPKLLLDDYVKFLRWSQELLVTSGNGMLAMITNHGYLDSPTFRKMRQLLASSFRDIHVLNLHGNAKRKEQSPDGSQDENVFDIQQGVAISVFLRRSGDENRASVRRSDFWGSRVNKYQFLLGNTCLTTEATNALPEPPFYVFAPHDRDMYSEYVRGQRITDIMPVNSTGVKTHRDNFAFALDSETLRRRVSEFRDLSISDQETIAEYDLRDTRDWKIGPRRKSLAANAGWERYFTSCLYRPFDLRAYYHHEDVVELPRNEVMRHLLRGQNLALLTNRQVLAEFHHAFCTHHIADNCAVSLESRERTYVFPLYLFPESADTTGLRTLFDHAVETSDITSYQANLSPAFISEIKENTGLGFLSNGGSDLKNDFGPEDVFCYVYAILHSPDYRTRYAEFLKIDFPRVPLTSSLDLFRALAALGGELVALHLVESPALEQHITTYSGPTAPEVGRVGWSDGVVWLDARATDARAGQRATKPGTIGFHGVPGEVWDFHIGGYQVCHKWLKDRKGRVLFAEDIDHYQRIVVALNETIRIMGEIDDVIEEHGGWPIQ